MHPAQRHFIEQQRLLQIQQEEWLAAKAAEEAERVRLAEWWQGLSAAERQVHMAEEQRTQQLEAAAEAERAAQQEVQAAAQRRAALAAEAAQAVALEEAERAHAARVADREGDRREALQNQLTVARADLAQRAEPRTYPNGVVFFLVLPIWMVLGFATVPLEPHGNDRAVPLLAVAFGVAWAFVLHRRRAWAVWADARDRIPALQAELGCGDPACTRCYPELVSPPSASDSPVAHSYGYS